MKLTFLLITYSLVLNAQHPGDDVVREGGNAFYNYEFEWNKQKSTRNLKSVVFP